MKRKWDVSSKEVRKKCIDEVLARLEAQGDAVFGVLAAEELVGIVLQNVGPDIYNLALRDAKKLLQERFADIETELDLLDNQN